MSSRRSRKTNSSVARQDAALKTPMTPVKEAAPPRVNPNLVAGILVALFFAFALFIRAYLPYHQVFTNVGIKFTSNDSYFFMRLVDNIIRNFPHHTNIDPYLQYPAYGAVGVDFFVWLLTVPAWIIGLGSPSQHTIDVIDAWLPAVMGALTVFPVYFIGKELFNRWAGVLSAALIAMLPGEFLGRSILGFTDNHVAETLFTAVAMLFLVLAVKTASQRQLNFSHIMQRDWAVIKRPLIYSLLAGFSLGVYIFTWLGALLFVFMAFLFFVIQFIVDHLKRKSTDYLCFVGVVFFFVALVMAKMVSSSMLYIASMFIATLAMVVLSGISRWMAHKKMMTGLYPLSLVGLAAVAIGFLFLADRPLFESMLGAFVIFSPAGAQLTTIEMQRLISPIYGNPFAIAYGNFPGLLSPDPVNQVLNFRNFISFIFSGFSLSLISSAILIYLIIRKGTAEKGLLVVWSLVILAATLGQRRFGYYLAINVALLTGYLSWLALRSVGRRYSEVILLGLWLIVIICLAIDRLGPYVVVNIALLAGYILWRIFQLAGSDASHRRARARKADSAITLKYAMTTMAVLVVFQAIFAPIFLFPAFKDSPTIGVASTAPYAPTDGWVSSLNWLKDNSPEPLGNPDVYYQVQQQPATGANYTYPASVYSVVAWWDYGYWITRIAHRIPVANPSQDAQAIKKVASFFTTGDEKAASALRDEMASKYFVLDHETTLSKFWAIITWAGRRPTEFFDSYLVQQQGQTTPNQVTLYYPAYYNSMAVRLFNFDAKAVTPDNVIVIAYQERNFSGNVYKVVSDVKQYPTYQEAEAFVSGNQSGNYRIVGVSPMKSPVPLEALANYRLVHGSETTISLQDVGDVPQVKVFEYAK